MGFAGGVVVNASSSSSSCSSSSSISISHHHHHHNNATSTFLDLLHHQSLSSLPMNPFLYHHPEQQQQHSFDGEMIVLKPEPLSLSLSSHNNNNNNSTNRYGSVVVGGGGGGCVIPGSVVSAAASNNNNNNNNNELPFTGYAAVLKGSRFLRPAHILLEEVREAVGARGICGGNESIAAADASLLMEAPPPADCGIGLEEDPLESMNNNNNNFRLLLTMLDEVYRRYRQYYQQVHSVVSSFEYVAGLGNAAPYASFAINAMSKHFRCLKNAIIDQIQFINKARFRMSSNVKDESPRFRFDDRGPYIQKPGLPEQHQQQQPVWRPQRGLPERAVSVLRAWLFEHFLHPYPTDTDKLMLAKQTGLSRNQVSNWFINARVRLWKPMVEEIHTLESQQDQNEEHSRNKSSDHLPSDNSHFTENPSTSAGKFQDAAPYKRARNEIPDTLARNQEQQAGVSMGSGASNGVSLTLGLHHQDHGVGLFEYFPMSAAQRFGLPLVHEGYVTSGFDSQNRHFGRGVVIGGQLLHDFVG